MIKNIKILMLNEIQKFYRKMVHYCSRKAQAYMDKGRYCEADHWRIRMHKYFMKQCDVALKIVEMAP